MYEFHPYFTNDGSVGLYSPEYNDIYHSATGALTEAVEKFVLPVDMNNLLNKDSISVLDICYGLGYNSKSFLNFILKNYCEKFYNKNLSKNSPHAEQSIDPIYTNKITKADPMNIDTIDTNNITSKNDQKLSKKVISNYTNIDTIHGNKTLPIIFIKAIDNDKILTHLSPFIKTGAKNYKSDNIDFDYKKIEKYLKPEKRIKNIKIENLINYLIFYKIAQCSPDILFNQDIATILLNKKYKAFFEPELVGLYKFYQNIGNKMFNISSKWLFLHNIYYRYISNRYKKQLKMYKLQDLCFELVNDDARKAIKDDTNQYDLIFLDAFTPSKCPCLWSYEFFELLKSHLKPDGKILTYSTSTAVRAAMIEAGLQVGYIYNAREKKYSGTIASPNKTLIKIPLSEYDLSLIKTTAGIFYRDKNLTGQNEAILKRRNLEVKYSDRTSSSQFKKKH